MQQWRSNFTNYSVVRVELCSFAQRGRRTAAASLRDLNYSVPLFTRSVGGVTCVTTLPYVSSCNGLANRGQLQAAVLSLGISLLEGRLIKTFVTVMCGHRG